MKLIDFDDMPEMNDLLKTMGAKRVYWVIDNVWNAIDDDKLSEILAAGEVEVSIDEIDDIEVIDGVFLYKGQRVIVYIRDQVYKYYEQGYKFHFTKCNTISDAFINKRDTRYVLSMRTDGYFSINLMDDGEVVQRGLVEPLRVCRNCLRSVNYQGYSTAGRERKDQIYEEFELEEYFKKYKRDNLKREDFRRSNEW